MKSRVGARIALVLAATLGVLTLPTSASGQVVTARTVLCIHSGAETFPVNPMLEATLRETLASRPDVPIDYFAEYLEADLFPRKEASLAFKDYIRQKYQDRRIDVVIAITDTALRFAISHRGELFPDAPIVFTGLEAPDAITRQAGAGLTGIQVGFAYGETLKLALELHPSTEHVFVVAKAPDERTVASVSAEFRDFSRRVTFTYLKEPTVPRLLALIKGVPPRSVILYIWHSQLDPGHIMYSDQVARLVAQAAPVPVYGTSDIYVGSGVVGGVVRSNQETAARVGDVVLRILTGTDPRDIPIEHPRVVPILDWRQLQRWGIDESRVPAGALIRFREPSVWDRYRVYWLTGGAVLLAQTALIVGLLVQHRRRQQAEDQVRRSQAELRTSYERIRDLGSRLLGAQDSERSRIARELHDDISQKVALLTIDLELLTRAAQPDGEKLIGEALNRTHDIARSVHDLSHRLHPAKLRLIGLVSALGALQRELSRPDMAIAFTHDNVPAAVPPDLTLCLFRIAQEALQNALKYSSARTVSVHLSGRPEGLTLTVIDDGVGFDVDEAWGKGLGLISIDERLEATGGTFEIRSKHGAGTRLEVKVPLSVVQSPETTVV